MDPFIVARRFLDFHCAPERSLVSKIEHYIEVWIVVQGLGARVSSHGTDDR